jgi:hypothetical protein
MSKPWADRSRGGHGRSRRSPFEPLANVSYHDHCRSSHFLVCTRASPLAKGTESWSLAACAESSSKSARRSSDSGRRHIRWQDSKAPQTARQHRVATAIAKLLQVAEQRVAAKPLTDAQRKLLEFSVQIFDEPAIAKYAAYMPRELVQITLPHKDPGNVPV